MGHMQVESKLGENYTEVVSPSCVDDACFLTECCSNSQGQSAAKRQRKLKKVLIVSSLKRCLKALFAY